MTLVYLDELEPEIPEKKICAKCKDHAHSYCTGKVKGNNDNSPLHYGICLCWRLGHRHGGHKTWLSFTSA